MTIFNTGYSYCKSVVHLYFDNLVNLNIQSNSYGVEPFFFLFLVVEWLTEKENKIRGQEIQLVFFFFLL